MSHFYKNITRNYNKLKVSDNTFVSELNKKN